MQTLRMSVLILVAGAVLGCDGQREKNIAAVGDGKSVACVLPTITPVLDECRVDQDIPQTVVVELEKELANLQKSAALKHYLTCIQKN